MTGSVAEKLGGGPGKLLELCERLEQADRLSAQGQAEASKAFGSLLAHGIATGCTDDGNTFVEANADHGGMLTLACTGNRMMAKQSSAVYRDPTKPKSRCIPARSVEGEHPAPRIKRCLELWATTGRWANTNSWGLGLAAWWDIIKTMMAAARQMRQNPAQLEEMARTGRILLEPRSGSTTTIEASISSKAVEICFRSTGTPVLVQATRPYGLGVNTVRLNWDSVNGLRAGAAESAAVIAGRLIADSKSASMHMPNTTGWAGLLKQLGLEAERIDTREGTTHQWQPVE